VGTLPTAPWKGRGPDKVSRGERSLRVIGTALPPRIHREFGMEDTSGSQLGTAPQSCRSPRDFLDTQVHDPPSGPRALRDNPADRKRPDTR